VDKSDQYKDDCEDEDEAYAVPIAIHGRCGSSGGTSCMMHTSSKLPDTADERVVDLDLT
jgi:hypothetical protein